MKLLLHNFFSSHFLKGVNTGYPLILRATKIERIETEFNGDFVKKMMPRLDYQALLQAANSVDERAASELPKELATDWENNDDFLRKLHSLLVNYEIVEGELECPESHRIFNIKEGIPNFLVGADEKLPGSVLVLSPRAVKRMTTSASVDFDYSGPPVCVSNGMALQLVSQFGIRSAWHAFLRMRGMKVNSEEANGAVDSLKYFHNKIGRLRREVGELKAQTGAEKEEQLLSENFDTFLVGSDSLELREGVEEYSEVDKKEFGEEMGNDDVRRRTSAKEGDEVGTDVFASESAEETAAATLLKVIKEQQQRLDQSKKGRMEDGQTESSSTVNVAVEKRENEWRKPTEKATLEQNRLLQKDEKRTQQSQEGRKEEIARRHAETIDDVVSLVLEKIRNNQPFEGELNMAPASSAAQMHLSSPTAAGTSKSFRGSAGGQRTPSNVSGHGKKQLREESAHGAEGTVQPQKQHFNTHTGNLSQMPSAGQSIVFLRGVKQMNSSKFTTTPSLAHQPMSKNDPAIIPGNLSEIIRASSSATNSAYAIPTRHPHHTVAGGAQVPQTIAAKLTSTQKKVPSQQQHQVHPQNQQQHLVIGGETSAELVVNGSGIPLDLAIQQGMTVQELIQTLKMVQQQETPDSSSSQEAVRQETQKFVHESSTKAKGTTSTPTKGKRRKEMPSEKGDAPEAKKQRNGRLAKQQTTPGGSGTEGEWKAEPPVVTNEDQKATPSRHQQEEMQQRLVERNKLTGQKKRADKLQTELDKSLDSVQLLQIDLACLKTDNNNLIAENIALKAENQQLRSKGSASCIHKKAVPSSTAIGMGGVGAAGALRGRKKANGRDGDGNGRNEKQKQSEKMPTLPERTRTPPPLSSELGRRQSKRICVARSQFMKAFY
uniref:Multifunctional methyltransferase subunit TRM112-like protein n=1 Tax=Globodera rostochiensis TaxID=31243 RepID=A0A914HYZ9_GLORO